MEILIANLAASKVQRKTLAGRSYLVAPVAMIVEGVFTGNQGAVLYERSEITKSISSWNHKPITVGHPKQGDQFVSGCLPDAIEHYSVGMILNTSFNISTKKLRADAWFDESRLDVVPGGHAIKAALAKQEPMEVSTGLFVDKEITSGQHNGKEYSGKARNFRPDHLAVIVNGVGACSVKDGAGLLVNKEPVNTESEKNLADSDTGGKLLENRIQEVRESKPLIVNEKVKMKREEILAVIGESHQEFVTNLSDDQVVALAKLQRTVTVEVPVVNEAPKNLDELLASAPADVKAKIEEAFAVNTAHRDGLIDKIVANEKNQFSKEELVALPTATLDKMAVFAVNAAPAPAAGSAPAPAPRYAGSAAFSDPKPSTSAVKGFLPPSTYSAKA
jgi:hypothetical protein